MTTENIKIVTKIAYQDVVECFDKLPNSRKNLKIIRGASHGLHGEPFETQVVDVLVTFFEDKDINSTKLGVRKDYS